MRRLIRFAHHSTAAAEIKPAIVDRTASCYTKLQRPAMTVLRLQLLLVERRPSSRRRDLFFGRD